MKKLRGVAGFLYRHSFIRYVFVGSTTIIVDIATLTLLREVFDIHLGIAASFAYWLSIAYNFSMNRWWTFSAQEAKSLAEHAVLYISLLVFNYFYTLVALGFLNEHMHYTIAKLLIILAATTWTYPIYKRYIFRKDLYENIQ